MSVSLKKPWKLPNLIIIGAMKCGTSSLHEYLSLHPQVHMSSVKELDFFIEKKNYHKGIDWYTSYFDGDAKIFGESSPNYTKAPFFDGVPERMYSLVPNAKLIYIVRDPIERIISHYSHQYLDRAEHRSFEDALSDLGNSHYFYTSRYEFQLDKFLKYFSSSQVLVLRLEELSQHPTETLRKVFGFLNINENFYHPSFSLAFHQSNQKRRLSRLGASVMKVPFGGRFVKRLSLMTEDFEKPVVNPSLKEKILALLKEDSINFPVSSSFF